MTPDRLEDAEADTGAGSEAAAAGDAIMDAGTAVSLPESPVDTGLGGGLSPWLWGGVLAVIVLVALGWLSR